MKPLSKIKALFRRNRFDAEMAEEMRLHLALQTERNLENGMNATDAHFAAQRQFGGVEQIKETARDQRSWIWLEQFFQDVRFAARGLRRNPGFTVVAVLTLGFGIGVNTSIFTALQSVLMRKLPFPDAERLVQVYRTSPQSQRWPHSPANFLDQQAENEVFERMAALTGKPFNFAEPGQPTERIGGMLVSADFFPMLDVQPALGRVFSDAENQPGANRVAVLDHGFWIRRFAGDPDILGRTLRLDGETVTIVGVMPATFRDRPIFGAIDIWTPIAFTPEQRRNRGGNYLKSIARLKPGVTLDQAQAAMDALAAKHSREYPESNSEIGLRLVRLIDSMDPRARTMIWLTMMLAAFVLLIACANLANLQFARTARRTHELAVRGALGASRGRLLRQLLTESLIIALIGGVLGIVLATWGNDLIGRQINQSGELALTLNLRVLGFAFAVSTVAGFAFGLIPAWLASRANPNEAMKHGSRGSVGDRARNRVQHGLIVAEVALALVLLAGAGLVGRGLHQFAFQHPGWEIDGLTVGTLNLPDGKYGSAERQRAFVERLQEKLEALPGVQRASLTWSLPIRAFNTAGNFTIAGRPAPPPGLEPVRFLSAVTPGYFETFKMRLVSGRDFNAGDQAGRPDVVIVNETMARVLWPNESALGQRIDGEEIVGVVNDVRFPTDPSEPTTKFQTYRPFAQAPRTYLSMAIRGNLTVEMLRRTVAELDVDLTVIDPGTARASVEQALDKLNAVSWLLGAFGSLGLLLASLGIYGVIAGFVVQRTSEIGVRMALGAQLRDVLWLVLGKGLRLALVGAAIGLIGAFGLSRMLSSFAVGIGGNDPLAIAMATAVLVLVAMLACWLPARRAARVDPMTALRCE